MKINRNKDGLITLRAGMLLAGALLATSMVVVAQEKTDAQGPEKGSSSSAAQPAVIPATQSAAVDTVEAEIALRKSMGLPALPRLEPTDYRMEEDPIPTTPRGSVPRPKAAPVFGDKVLDKTKYPTQPVKVNFIPPAKVKKVQGWVKVIIERGNRRLPDQWCEVKNNSITMNLTDDATFRLDLSCLPGVIAPAPIISPADWDNPPAVDGLRLKKSAQGSRSVQVSLQPAGAVRYQVFMADGSRMTGFDYELVDPEGKDMGVPAEQAHEDWINQDNQTSQQVLISKLPLNKPFWIFSNLPGTVGRRNVEVLLTPDKPAREVTLRVAVGETYTVSLTDPQGKPTQSLSALVLLLDAKGERIVTSLEFTNRGEFLLKHMDVAPGQTLRLIVGGRTNFQREVINLDPAHTEVTVQLKAGLNLMGKLVDDASGQPLSHERLYLNSGTTPPEHAIDIAVMEQVTTNDKGEFTFTTASPGLCQVNGQQLEGVTGNIVDMTHPPTEPIVVRVKSIKPRKRVGAQ